MFYLVLAFHIRYLVQHLINFVYHRNSSWKNTSGFLIFPILHLGFYLYEISRISKSAGTERRLAVAKGWGRGVAGSLGLHS